MIIECWVYNRYCHSSLIAKMFDVHEATVSKALTKYFSVPIESGQIITLKSKV